MYRFKLLLEVMPIGHSVNIISGWNAVILARTALIIQLVHEYAIHPRSVIDLVQWRQLIIGPTPPLRGHNAFNHTQSTDFFGNTHKDQPKDLIISNHTYNNDTSQLLTPNGLLFGIRT
ncbi:hypothetical protein LOAG_02463 [Loa loa]|uniref:Uncharacterized protein n=1 Tax=Loa loa TaxID=7209 RepID=A0A1S0U6W4_LOALO|nr:hypothetical protein LOAG_02463 [Loa loa]EFO26019.1 hypothetical protein LOAG_02463 [Loa loa]